MEMGSAWCIRAPVRGHVGGSEKPGRGGSHDPGCLPLTVIGEEHNVLAGDGLTISDHPSGIVDSLGCLGVLNDPDGAATGDMLSSLGRVNPASTVSIRASLH